MEDAVLDAPIDELINLPVRRDRNRPLIDA